MIVDSVSWVMLGSFAGFGTHLDPNIALARALTEAIQSRLTEIAGSRDDIVENVIDNQNALEAFTVLQEEMLTTAPAGRFDARQTLATESFKEDVEVLLKAVQRVGVSSVVAVDLSKQAIGIPVVKVIVPGLEGLRSISRPGARLRAYKQRIDPHNAAASAAFSNVLFTLREEF